MIRVCSANCPLNVDRQNLLGHSLAPFLIWTFSLVTGCRNKLFGPLLQVVRVRKRGFAVCEPLARLNPRSHSSWPGLSISRSVAVLECFDCDKAHYNPASVGYSARLDRVCKRFFHFRYRCIYCPSFLCR